MIAIAILKFTAVSTSSVHEAIIDCYYLFFGIVTVLSQLNFKRISDQFRFINYYWGKALFSLFLASLSFSGQTQSFTTYILSIYFMICALCFLALIFCDSKADKRQAKKDALVLLKMLENEEVKNDFEKMPIVQYF